MGKDRKSWHGVPGVLLTLGCLGISGEHVTALDGSELAKRPDNVDALAVRMLPDESATTLPLLWGVQWKDVEPSGVSIHIQIGSVSRRPRQVGPFTFESFQEVVATKVQVRVADRLDATRRIRRADNAFHVVNRLQERLGGLYAMVRGGGHSKADATQLFTGTVLSGVIFEDLRLEVVQDDGVWRLRSRTMSTALEESGWVLQGVEVETADGRLLTLDEAVWDRHGRMVSRGPYILEENGKRAAGSSGCFVVRLRDAVEIRGPIPENADAAVCASYQLLAQDPIGLPTEAVSPLNGGGAWPNFRMASLTKKFSSLAWSTIPLQTSGGHRAER